MTEHCIRLRGGWECSPLDPPASQAFRLTLPTHWDSARPQRLRLTRYFNRPPLHPKTQVWLRLEEVSGLHHLVINGQAEECVSPDESRYEILLPSLRARNLLDLEIETPRSIPSAQAPTSGWGAIALVIRTVDRADPP